MDCKRIFSFLALLSAAAVASGKRISGVLKTEKDWIFLDRFCFLPTAGILQFNFRYPRKFMVQSLLLYWDKPNLWSMVYNNDSMTCAQKESLLDVNSYQIFRLDPDYGTCVYSGNDSVTCNSRNYPFSSSRERWWFMAISNCLGKNGLYLEYDVFMRNGTVLYAMSQILMVLMLLLLSLGYTVVCGRLPHWATTCLIVFMFYFAIAYIALYIVEAVTFDAALVLYRYESSPGYGLMAVILACWLFYVGCSIFTMSKHKKVVFYTPMLVFYSLWFIAIPITVAVNINQVPDYMRAKVVNFIEVISLFLAHLFYLILTWPSLANKNFPFHIRTTQISDFAFDPEQQDPDLTDGRQFTDFSVFGATNARSESSHRGSDELTEESPVTHRPQ
uniref:GpcrRhopsn4 domain-containing protein n=1 Tax=Macrostomum lignano TaxID=282301 RepID=A0A1I8JLE3_9PLAT